MVGRVPLDRHVAICSALLTTASIKCSRKTRWWNCAKTIAPARPAARSAGLCNECGDVASASLAEEWIEQGKRRAWFLFQASHPDHG